MSDQAGTPAAAAQDLVTTADRPCADTRDPSWWDPRPGERLGAWAARIVAAVDDSTARLAAATADGTNTELAAAKAGHMWGLLNAYAAADRAQHARRRRGLGRSRGRGR